jgi:hypothetical protein
VQSSNLQTGYQTFQLPKKPVGIVLKSAEDIGVNLPGDVSDISDWSFVMR